MSKAKQGNDLMPGIKSVVGGVVMPEDSSDETFDPQINDDKIQDDIEAVGMTTPPESEDA